MSVDSFLGVDAASDVVVIPGVEIDINLDLVPNWSCRKAGLHRGHLEHEVVRIDAHLRDVNGNLLK